MCEGKFWKWYEDKYLAIVKNKNFQLQLQADWAKIIHQKISRFQLKRTPGFWKDKKYHIFRRLLHRPTSIPHGKVKTFSLPYWLERGKNAFSYLLYLSFFVFSLICVPDNVENFLGGCWKRFSIFHFCETPFDFLWLPTTFLLECSQNLFLFFYGGTKNIPCLLENKIKCTWEDSSEYIYLFIIYWWMKMNSWRYEHKIIWYLD